ncbi:hypothetical protein TNCV_3666401 [Trichonephila clavipes]|uniref:Uncharacterized protein n=1 Tax=Trichonephila clavipes TaxID=2585209 RepID=A0A8X6S3A3_TRICX|nr:hypothetical protein TNCV_3666401 [Trichonephila clavipes]
MDGEYRQVTINEAIKSKLNAKPVHSVYITGDQLFVRKEKSLETMDSSPPTTPAFMVSGSPTPQAFRVSPLFLLQSLSSTVQDSFFLSSPQVFSIQGSLLPYPKKTLLNTRGGSTTRPSSLLIGRPQRSTLGLPSPIRA